MSDALFKQTKPVDRSRVRKIIEIRSVADLHLVAEAWDRLRQQQLTFFPDFQDLQEYLVHRESRFLVLGVSENGAITSLCCLTVGSTQKRYTMGERKLFSLPVREARLFGSAILGSVDPAAVRSFMNITRRALSFDLLAIGEVIIDSPLHAALQCLGLRFLVSSPSRKDSIHWLIRMPETFDEYLASLGSKTRQMVKQAMRKFESSFDCEFKIISEPQQIGPFLRDGEAVSRRTYQWNVGQRLRDDAATLNSYRVLAAKNRLRCHLLYVDGAPCSFSRGEVLDGIYSYHTPGFDPKYSKLSPGIVTLMFTIKDLIENTDCRIFDFGEGGDDVGYKSKFGNVSMNSKYIYVSSRLSPYSITLFLLQEGLTGLKNLLSFIVGNGPLRRRLKKAFRKYGTPSQ